MTKQRGIVFTMLVAIVGATGALSMVAVGTFSSRAVCDEEKALLEATDKAEIAKLGEAYKPELRVWRQCMRKT